MRTFKATGSYEITGRGTVYVGESPFEFMRDKSLEAFSGSWLIDHPDTKGKTFRVVGVESHCLLKISEGAPIGLMVQEYNLPTPHP